jgi:hypothetical protein
MPDMPRGWQLIILSFSGLLAFFTLLLWVCRIKAKYCHREIEDIKIFDYSQKQEKDFDSPSILTVYFEELIEYE